MGPDVNHDVTGTTAAEEAEEARLNAARDSFPEWEIMDTYDGYVAVPKGTVTLFAINLDNLVAKLRQQPEGTGAAAR